MTGNPSNKAAGTTVPSSWLVYSNKRLGLEFRFPPSLFSLNATGATGPDTETDLLLYFCGEEYCQFGDPRVVVMADDQFWLDRTANDLPQVLKPSYDSMQTSLEHFEGCEIFRFEFELRTWVWVIVKGADGRKVIFQANSSDDTSTAVMMAKSTNLCM